jgi:hypothetical protein
MAGVTIVSYPLAEEDIAQAHTAADLHMPMAADQATARDTGLLHAQACVPATHTPTSDVPLVHVPVVDAPVAHRLVVDDLAAHRRVGDVLEAVARAVPDSWLCWKRPPYGGLFLRSEHRL